MLIKKGTEMDAGLWVALTVIGTALLLSKQLAGHNVVTWVLVRAAALFYLAAGVVQPAGWIGRWTSAAIEWFIRTFTSFSTSAVGTGIALGVLVFVGAVGWLLAILPDSWWGGQMPDWASVSGLTLPALAVAIPGPAGQWLREDVFPALSQPMISGVAQLFGG